MACPPQAPQIAAWNSRGPSLARARLATARHDGHRCGSFVKPLVAKKACSPAEKMNSSAQSRQVRLRSWYTLARPSLGSDAMLTVEPAARLLRVGTNVL